MWDSWKDPHREQVLYALAQLYPKISSVYELGAGSGPNLRLIRDVHPSLNLSGCEPNDGLREFAKTQDLNLEFAVLPALIPPFDWDVVLSVYTLAYVQDAYYVLNQLHKQHNKHLILIEPTANVHPFGAPGLYEGHAMMSYVHPYQALAESAGWKTMWRWPIVPHHQGLNCVLVLAR